MLTEEYMCSYALCSKRQSFAFSMMAMPSSFNGCEVLSSSSHSFLLFCPVFQCLLASLFQKRYINHLNIICGVV